MSPTMRFDIHDLTEGIRALELARDVVDAWAVEFRLQPEPWSPWELAIHPKGGAPQLFSGHVGQSFTDLCLTAVRQIRSDIAAGGLS